jgi:hypothetical protein
MILNRQISTDGHVVLLGVEQAKAAWDVREQLDATTVCIAPHEDWHRVECALRALELEVRCRGIAAVGSHH